MPHQEVALSIDLKLPEKLRDREYRRQFFWAETSADIARDLIKLRKRRRLSQKQLADLIGTKQPAISRIEKADYEHWNLNTLRTIADVEDARIRVIIEPAEDVLAEYEASSNEVEEEAAVVSAAGNTVAGSALEASSGTTFNVGFGKSGAVTLRTYEPGFSLAFPRGSFGSNKTMTASTDVDFAGRLPASSEGEAAAPIVLDQQKHLNQNPVT
jgi:transcriptional regulator with XRE-family HTH domain